MANTYVITRLTNTPDILDLHPEIDGDHVVWMSGRQVLQYIDKEIISIPYPSLPGVNPRVAVSQGRVVWNGRIHGSSEIYVFDGTSLSRITNNNTIDGRPDISGKNITWLNQEEGALSNVFNLHVYDGTSINKIVTGVSAPESISSPKVSGEKIAWIASTNIVVPQDPSLGKNISKLVVFDGETTRTIRRINTKQTGISFGDIAISGNNVVWIEKKRKGNLVSTNGDVRYTWNNDRIFLFNGENTVEIPVKRRKYGTGIYSIDISENKVVWAQNNTYQTDEFCDEYGCIYYYENTDTEIYEFDGSGITRVTNNSVRDSNPAISGDTIVWESNADIYKAELDSSFDIESRETIFGGDPGGSIPDYLNPTKRRIWFDLRGSNSNSIKKQWNGRDVWILIHGWNDKSSSFKEMGEAVRRSNPGDLVLLLDWRNAAYNSYGNDLASQGRNLLEGLNGKAASWISSVADLAYEHLQKWGENRKAGGIKGKHINLIGHSLGSLVSAEIASRFKSNSLGRVNTLTALDPPSDANLVNGYDLNYSAPGIQSPNSSKFSQVARFSRSFLGSRSVAGNDTFSSWAHESILMDFGDNLDIKAEHQWVKDTFVQLVSPHSKEKNLATELFGARKDDVSHPDILKNQFKIFAPASRKHEGFIRVQAPNQSIYFVAKSTESNIDNLIYGTNGNDSLSDQVIDNGRKRDKIIGGKGDDILISTKGNDILLGNEGDDWLRGNKSSNNLYGGLGNDTLTGTKSSYSGNEIDRLNGGGGADIFVLGDKSGVFYAKNSNRDRAIIRDFRIDQDTIQLNGSASNYELKSISNNTHIIHTDGKRDLIGIVKGENIANFSTDFSFV